MYVDTHCHLEMLEDVQIEELLPYCQNLGIENLITIATRPEGLSHIQAMANKFPPVFCTQGIHPHPRGRK